MADGLGVCDGVAEGVAEGVALGVCDSQLSSFKSPPSSSSILNPSSFNIDSSDGATEGV